MRALGRTLLVLLGVMSALLLVQKVWEAMRWDELAAVLSGRIENALPSIGYAAVDDRWLEFKLSAKGRALRVRSNAVVDAYAPYEPGIEWWYAFEYQFLDDRGEVLREGVYHHRTRLTRSRDPKTGRLVGRNFLLDPAQDPTDGRSMLVHFDPMQTPALVRIRPLNKAPELRSLIFRVYAESPNPEEQLGLLWQRLSESKKTRLAGGSVYGLDLLREREKQNLLRREWEAVGPLGVEGEQYHATKLYITRELEGEIVDEVQVPFGLHCTAEVRGMVPIPPGNWAVSLDIVNLGSPADAQADVSVHWYGQGVTDRWQTQVPSATGEYGLEKRFDGGLLEIVAPVPLVVRAWGADAGERRELTPQPLRLRAYLVDGSGALSVHVDHVAAQPTPFRVDIRSRLQAGEAALDRVLDYELLDAQGGRISGGRLPIQLLPSSYDRLSSEEPGVRISEPAQFYFNLTRQVAAVRFSSPDELLLATYTRPPELVRRVRIPEDYLETADDLGRQPAWFLLRPADEERLRREFRSVMLTVQPRPPETDPRLFAGDYDWTLYQPVGSWRARQLLVPRRDELPLRDRSLDAVYRELGTGAPLQVSFRRLPGRREATPRLLYLRDRASPLSVQVRLGDRVHSTAQIAGRQGEIELPAVRAGSERLVIAAKEPVRWFIDQADAQAPAYLRRLAMELTDAELTFEYQKESGEAEVLSGELYLSSHDRSGLRVTIAGDPPGIDGPAQEWTFRERLYDVKAPGTAQIAVLNSSMPPLAGGQRFFLPLGSDLPPGRYRISFALEGASKAYLTLYRLTAGQRELRRFFRESADVQEAGF